MSIKIKISYIIVQNIILWILICSGPIKSVLPYLHISIDLTFWAFILVSADIFFSIFFRYQSILLDWRRIFSLAIVIGMFFIMILSLLYSPSPNFSYLKTYLFFANIICFIYPLFIIKIDFNLLARLFLTIFLPISIWFFVARYLFFSPYNVGYSIIDSAFYDIRGFYLGFGYGLSLLTLILIYLKKPSIYVIIILLTILGLGARGALLFLFIIIIIWKWKSILKRMLLIKISKRNLRRMGFTLILGIPIVIIFGNKIYKAISLGLYRFSSLLNFSQDSSSLGRLDRMGFALNSIFGSWSTFLFGNGVGSFGIMYSGEDIRDFPHNIFMEGWFEMGVVFFFLLVFFLIYPFFLRRITFYKMLALAFLLNSLKSGDLGGSWLLFLMYGILIFNPKIRNEIRI